MNEETNEEIKNLTEKIKTDPNASMTDGLALIILVLKDEIAARKKLQSQIDELKSKIERMRNRVDGIESDRRRC
jgi:TolA-binding protein